MKHDCEIVIIGVAAAMQGCSDLKSHASEKSEREPEVLFDWLKLKILAMNSSDFLSSEKHRIIFLLCWSIQLPVFT